MIKYSKHSVIASLMMILIGVTVYASSSLAQCLPAYIFTGEAVGDNFGYFVSSAGDVNNDGFDDVIVGAHNNDIGGNSSGRAYVYSGQTGGILHTFNGASAEDRFGVCVSGAGDVNSDGFDDVIIGAHASEGHAGRAYVYSGQTGGLLYEYVGGGGNWLGHGVSGVGDVNSDGYDDFIIGAYGVDSNSGRVYVYSGQTGTLLYTLIGEALHDHFGAYLSGGSDVNGDGNPDIIVGAYKSDSSGADAGRVYVYSGPTGALLHTFTGEAAGDWFGYSVSDAGDVNNDGFADIIVGALLNNTGGTGTGRAYVYSGQTGTIIHTFTGEAVNDFLGHSVSGAGDVNNDGFDDVIVSSHGNDAGGIDAGRAEVYSGQTGGLLYRFTGEAAGDRFGIAVSGAGDIDNDGIADVIVGAYVNDAGGVEAGRAYVYSLLDTDGDGYGDLCDICPGFDDSTDSDSDGAPDGCDTCPNDADDDYDGDGICGDIDNCPNCYDPANSTDCLNPTRAFWKFNDAQCGPVAINSEADTLHGLFSHSMIDADGACVTKRSAVFSGDSTWMTVAHDGQFNFGLGDFTIEAIIQTDVITPSFTSLVSHGLAGDSRMGLYQLGLNNGLLYFEMDSTGPAFSISGATLVADGAWRRVAIVVSRNESNTLLELFVDGVSDGQASLARDLSATLTASADLNVGRDRDGLGIYNGRIDDIRISCAALDASEFINCNISAPLCCDFAGDANNDGSVTIADVTYLISRIFACGNPPACEDQGDANGDGSITIGDVTYLIARIFSGGPAPICGATGD